jgi:hypothetical protein
MECDQQSPHHVQLEGIDEDTTYAIFVSYVEVYNNAVYDLLEDNLECGKSKYELQINILNRTYISYNQTNHNMCP